MLKLLAVSLTQLKRIHNMRKIFGETLDLRSKEQMLPVLRSPYVPASHSSAHCAPCASCLLDAYCDALLDSANETVLDVPKSASLGVGLPWPVHGSRLLLHYPAHEVRE